MTTSVPIEPPRVFPTFRYQNGAAMIDWLVGIFGFTVHAKYMDGDKVSHAELAFGSSMIMLGDAKRPFENAIPSTRYS